MRYLKYFEGRERKSVTSISEIKDLLIDLVDLGLFVDVSFDSIGHYDSHFKDVSCDEIYDDEQVTVFIIDERANLGEDAPDGESFRFSWDDIKDSVGHLIGHLSDYYDIGLFSKRESGSYRRTDDNPRGSYTSFDIELTPKYP